MNTNVRSTENVTQQQARLGWVGAGKMGAPMIRNLLARNLAVSVTETDEGRLSPLVSAGASPTKALEEQSASDIVFATLPNDAVLLGVVLGDGTHPGLATEMVPGSSFVEMSTVSPEASSRVAEALSQRGVSYLRAPLSGSTTLAEQATLTVLASGDKAAWDAALPYLEIMSAQRFFLGDGDEARFMKLVLNTLVGASSALLSEALALGASGGLSHASMMEVIGQSAVASPLFKYKVDTIVEGDYSPAFTIGQMIKDFTLISDAARSNQVPLFTTGLILELYRAAANAGLKEQDFFALVKWHSDLSHQ
ncbi:MAG: NAD(P)-dependent oxidoreductase [Pseudomonadota bacterium]